MFSFASPLQRGAGLRGKHMVVEALSSAGRVPSHQEATSCNLFCNARGSGVVVISDIILSIKAACLVRNALIRHSAWENRSRTHSDFRD
jgi:hypothetical protein